MSEKLASFLRVMASGFSPQAAAFITLMFMQEQDENDRIAGEERADV